MARNLEGRVRYDTATDSFVYEIRSDGEWGMCMAAKCVRREGAEEGEDTNYIHYDILKTVARDAQIGVKIHLA